MIMRIPAGRRYNAVQQIEGESTGNLVRSYDGNEPSQSRSEILGNQVLLSSAAHKSFLIEIWDLVKLSIPIAISRLSWVAMKTTDTALIGHTGTRFLTATALSDLYTSSTGVFIQGGVLSIFASQAVGSPNKRMAGAWAQVSLFVISIIAIPVMIAWACTGPLLRAFRTSGNLVDPASYYALVLMIAIPPRVCISQISQYFMAQRITDPLVNSGLIAMVVNLVLGLVLVLGVPIPGWDGFGFQACAVITVCVEWLQLLIYVFWYCYTLRLHEECWPGWSWNHITTERVVAFTKMYLPAALSGASDWWRVSAIGLVCVSFGDGTSLAVFNSAYRILWICLIFIGSVGGALSVKVGNALGAGDSSSAQHITASAFIFAIVLLIALAVVVLAIPDKLAMIFSSDPEVIALYKEVALPLSFTVVAMNLSVLLERVPMICGRTQLVLFTGLIGSWGAQVPAVLLFTQLWRNDLYGLFTGVAIGYAVLDCIMIYVAATTDWERYAVEAQLRSEASPVGGGGNVGPSSSKGNSTDTSSTAAPTVGAVAIHSSGACGSVRDSEGEGLMSEDSIGVQMAPIRGAESAAPHFVISGVDDESDDEDYDFGPGFEESDNEYTV